MKWYWWVLIIILIATSIIAGVNMYNKNKKKSSNTKEDLVNKIFEKYKNEPNFDADRNYLMNQDMKTLEGLLDGTIR